MCKFNFKFGINFNSVIQKGQALAFFAIIFPVLFLCLAMAADFGWLYFNQSRLQNAADAAVVAGAKQLVFDKQNLSDYTYTKLVSSYDADLLRLAQKNTISTRITSDGDEVVKIWLKFNLEGKDKSAFKIVDISPLPGSKIVRDSTPAQWNTVKFSHMLYGSDAEDFKALYYVITVSEQLDHIFGGIISYFNKVFPLQIPHLEAKAVSVVKITHVMAPPDDPIHGPSLYEQMVALRNKEVYADWWEIKYEYDRTTNDVRKKNFDTTDTMTIARMNSVQAKGNEYVEGNFYRTETLTLHGWSIATTGNGNTSGKKMDQRDLDSLFIDLKADRSDSGLKDNDRGSNQTNYNLNVNSQTIKADSTFKNGITGNNVYTYRIHDMINIGQWNKTSNKYEYVYKVRPGKEPPDPLYVHIESEDNYVDSSAGNTVRQMIINVNAANTNENTDRPIFIFYEGPQKYYDTNGKESKKQTKWKEDWRESWKYLGAYEGTDYDADYLTHVRNSMPVIFNLNANFRGVLFMPNSPVVINGNGYDFEGFIVAERFLRLKTYEDFPEEARSTNATSNDWLYRKDGKGNEYYWKYFYYFTYYNKLAEYYYNGAEKGSKKYVQIAHRKNSVGSPITYNGKNIIDHLNVIYATGNFEEYTEDPFTTENAIEAYSEDDLNSEENILADDSEKKYNVYETTEIDATGKKVTKYYKIDGSYIEIGTNEYIKVKPAAVTTIKSGNKNVTVTAGDYYLFDKNFKLKKDEDDKPETEYLITKDYQITPDARFVHYTYTLITKEKSNLLNTFKDYEKDYVNVNPMYVDQFGNVQYALLKSGYLHAERPIPIDTEWHSGDVYEVIYNKDIFNLRHVRYNSYNKVRLIDYTNLNDTNRYINGEPLSDVFYTTIRSSWID